jgi:nitric oxide reductase subunit C
MRNRGNLTGGEVRSVLAFLQATNTDPRTQVQLAATPPAQRQTEVASGPASTDPAMIAQGETLMQQKACVGCHVVGGAGGAVGPRLNGVLNRKDIEFVRRKLVDPTLDNSTSMMPNFGLTAEEIEAIVAYLASLPND